MSGPPVQYETCPIFSNGYRLKFDSEQKKKKKSENEKKIYFTLSWTFNKRRVLLLVVTSRRGCRRNFDRRARAMTTMTRLWRDSYHAPPANSPTVRKNVADRTSARPVFVLRANPFSYVAAVPADCATDESERATPAVYRLPRRSWFIVTVILRERRPRI